MRGDQPVKPGDTQQQVQNCQAAQLGGQTVWINREDSEQADQEEFREHHEACEDGVIQGGQRSDSESDHEAGLVQNSVGPPGPHTGIHDPHSEMSSISPGEKTHWSIVPDYVYQEMIDNYLQEARLRFDKDKELKALQNAERWQKEQDR